jgi:hypothetical protein
MQIFPSILPDGENFVDDTYSRAELDRKDYPELQKIAAAHDTDAVDGNTPADEIREELTGKLRV